MEAYAAIAMVPAVGLLFIRNLAPYTAEAHHLSNSLMNIGPDAS
jgi:hypothetical protein